MRQWPNDPTVAHLVFVDHHHVPTTTTIEAACDHARRRGARRVRTSALFPAAAERVLAAGFEPIDRLALLRFDLGATDAATALAPPLATRPLRFWQHRTIAQIDQAAFGPLWGNDAAGVREILQATPAHRARTVGHGRQPVGFAISGAAGDHGYLQRLAIQPANRRHGFGAGLVRDALRWMNDSGLRTALVNTGLDNQPALTLYAALGFERLDDQLVIAERDFV